MFGSEHRETAVFPSNAKAQDGEQCRDGWSAARERERGRIGQARETNAALRVLYMFPMG